MARFKVKAIPNAKKNAVVGRYGDAVKIKIAAPANDGKANSELTEFLAGLLSLRKSDISIISGESSRDKIIEANISKEDIEKLFSPRDQAKI